MKEVASLPVIIIVNVSIFLLIGQKFDWTDVIQCKAQQKSTSLIAFEKNIINNIFYIKHNSGPGETSTRSTFIEIVDKKFLHSILLLLSLTDMIFLSELSQKGNFDALIFGKMFK